MKLILQAPINSLGYGVFALGYYKILRDRHEDLHVLPIGNPNIGAIEDLMDIIGVDKQDYIDRMIPGVNGLTDYTTLTIWHAHELNKSVGPNKYGHSTFETTKIHGGNSGSIRDSVNTVMTPSDWGVRVLREHNIKAECVPGPASLLGVDVSMYRNFDFLKNHFDSSTPIFMSSGKWEKRKNQQGILDAISNVDEPVNLIGLWDNPFTNGLVAPMEYLTHLKFNLARVLNHENNLIYIYKRGKDTVILVSYVKSYKDVVSLYNITDCYMSISCGEGWDLPLVETISMGIPSIASYNTAHTQYIESKDEFSLECTEELAKDGIFFDGNQGNWYPVKRLSDVSELMNKIIYYHGDEIVEAQIVSSDLAKLCNPDRIFKMLKDHCGF